MHNPEAQGLPDFFMAAHCAAFVFLISAPGEWLAHAPNLEKSGQKGYNHALSWSI